jgi:hypothetical protein
MSPDPKSHITWFDEDDWIGTEIVFETPHASRWRVDQKLSESEDCVTELDVQECSMQSSARGVFVCSSTDDPGKEAAVKIRMQYIPSPFLPKFLLTNLYRIPYFKTAYKRPSKRAEQAKPEVQPQTEEEVCALKRLTAAGCSSTPTFFAWKHETQGDDGWVPGGYIDYILMERVPGSRPNYWSQDMDKEERAELRKAFKPAWM